MEDLSNFLGNQRQDNKVDAVEFAGAHWQRNVSKQSPAIGSKNAHPGLGGGSFFLEICVKSAHPQQKKIDETRHPGTWWRFFFGLGMVLKMLTRLPSLNLTPFFHESGFVASKP